MNKHVSFGSTYKTYIDHHHDDKMLKKHNIISQIGEKIGKEDRYFSQNGNFLIRTIIAPDKFDNDIEAICKSNGIKFEKLDTADLLRPAAIIKRTVKTDGDAHNTLMVTLNADKLEELLKSQDGNYDHCKYVYENYFKEDTLDMLKSGEKIPAMKIAITENMADDVLDYVHKFGADKLNKNSLNIDFIQTVDDPNHCLYFAMKELGMDEMPVCVGYRTYDIGRKLGLFNNIF